MKTTLKLSAILIAILSLQACLFGGGSGGGSTPGASATPAPTPAPVVTTGKLTIFSTSPALSIGAVSIDGTASGSIVGGAALPAPTCGAVAQNAVTKTLDAGTHKVTASGTSATGVALIVAGTDATVVAGKCALVELAFADPIPTPAPVPAPTPTPAPTPSPTPAPTTNLGLASWSQSVMSIGFTPNVISGAAEIQVSGSTIVMDTTPGAPNVTLIYGIAGWSAASPQQIFYVPSCAISPNGCASTTTGTFVFKTVDANGVTLDTTTITF